MGAGIIESYSWANFELKLLGGDIVAMESFDFEHSADLEVNTGKGGEIVSYSIKEYKRSCKATIHMEEMERLALAAAPYGGDIVKLPPFPIVAISSPNGRPPLVYTVPAAKIIKFSAGWKKGDTKTELPLDFAILSQPLITFA